MKENSVGTLLWKDRITNSVEEFNSSFKIELIIPVVWMIALSKMNKDERLEIKQKINKHLSNILEKRPAWDTKLYDLMAIDINDLQKNFINVTVVLEKKIV